MAQEDLPNPSARVSDYKCALDEPSIVAVTNQQGALLCATFFFKLPVT